MSAAGLEQDTEHSEIAHSRRAFSFPWRKETKFKAVESWAKSLKEGWSAIRAAGRPLSSVPFCNASPDCFAFVVNVLSVYAFFQPFLTLNPLRPSRHYAFGLLLSTKQELANPWNQTEHYHSQVTEARAVGGTEMRLSLFLFLIFGDFSSRKSY